MLPTVEAPAAFLAARSGKSEKTPALYLVAGEKNSGKTSWCRELVAAAHAGGQSVRGLLSEPVLLSGHKVAIDLVDIAGRERRRLAVLRAWPGAVPFATALQRQGAVLPAAGRWDFDPAVLAWGNEILRRQGQSDLLVVDEIGPLEFNQGGGLQAAFTALSAERYRLGFLTVRPNLVDAARERWPQSQVLMLESGG